MIRLYAWHRWPTMTLGLVAADGSCRRHPLFEASRRYRYARQAHTQLAKRRLPDWSGIAKLRRGVAEGPWLRWYDSGQLLSEGQMKNGREHGRQRGWWPNGQLMLEGISVDGNRYKGFQILEFRWQPYRSRDQTGRDHGSPSTGTQAASDPAQ